MNHRARLQLTLLAICIGLGAPTRAADVADPGEADWPLVRITDKIQVLVGPFELPDEHNHGFRNTAVIVSTSAGLVVFDPGGSAWAGEMLVHRLQRLSPDPVVAVFNSHAHGDHWLGNEGVRRHYPDVAIYAHPTMKAKAQGSDGRMWLSTIERLTEGAAGGREVTPPNRTVADGEVITVGDTRFRILHTGAAHTDNDILIEVIGEDALFTGDIVRNGLLGIMESDASFAGNVAAIDAILAKGYAHYIPGHGPAGGAEIVLAYREYLATLLATVRDLYDAGLQDYEMKPEVVRRVARFSDWAGFETRVGAHVSRAYLEVEMEAF